MTKVVYGTYTFQDSDKTLYNGGTATLHYSPLGDELQADEFKIPIIFEPRTWSVTAEDFPTFDYGDPVDIYEGATLLYRFYLTDITGGKKLGNGRYLFYLEGVSFVGLYASIKHKGDIYSNSTVGAVIADILGGTYVSTTDGIEEYTTATGIAYRIPDTVSAIRIDGYLPYTDDARENLREVLQIASADPFIDTDGAPIFTQGQTSTMETIADTDIYAGDEYITQDPVTKVMVIEHSYVQAAGAVSELLYDGSSETLTSALVLFDAPCYDLSGSGLTIDDSGVNYAVVTGTGTLSGKHYQLNTQELEQATGLTGEENTVTLDNPLCSVLNSSALLAKMVNYYANASIVKTSMKVDPGSVSAGSYIKFSDPMWNTSRGFVQLANMLFSGITKLSGEVVSGWFPTDGGIYTEVNVLAGSGSWNVPNGATRVKFVLIGGGSGGWGGYPGTSKSSTDATDGGAAGEGGNGGNIETVVIEGANLAVSYTYAAGTAGSPGAINHGQGTDGTDSTLTDGNSTWTSATGSREAAGFLDTINGITYGATGQTGIYAGVRGWENGVGGRYSLTDYQTGVGGNTTWYSGGRRYGGGIYACGGGPAYGSDGEDPGGGGYAGSGADAVLDGFNGYTAPTPAYGCGGIGGNGGGGVGYGNYDAYQGLPGDGSAGGPAANGVVLAYVAYGGSQPVITEEWLLDSNSEQLYDYYYEKLKAQEA